MKEIDVLALRKLAAHSKTSKIGKLRSVFDDIEKLVNSGVPHQAIVDELNEQGLETNLANFKTMLFRIRKNVNWSETTAYFHREKNCLKINKFFICEVGD